MEGLVDSIMVMHKDSCLRLEGPRFSPQYHHNLELYSAMVSVSLCIFLYLINYF